MRRHKWLGAHLAAQIGSGGRLREAVRHRSVSKLQFVVIFYLQSRAYGYTYLSMANTQRHISSTFEAAFTSRALRALLGNELLGLLLI